MWSVFLCYRRLSKKVVKKVFVLITNLLKAERIFLLYLLIVKIIFTEVLISA